MKIGYADPPYPGQSRRHYADHPDYAGEVDHAALAERLREYDGWILHTSAPALIDVQPLFWGEGVRLCAWVKPFAAFKKNVPVAYAWEPVLIKACRKPVVGGRVKPLRDWLAESITLKRGLTGAKPEAVCWWAFECCGARPDDTLDDIYPGSGAVTRAWESWRQPVPTGPLQLEVPK